MRKLCSLIASLTLLLSFSLLIILNLCEPMVAQEKTPAMSDSAHKYLEQVLDLMQKNALHRSSIDWTQVRQETFTRAQNAQTTVDTYPAIAYAFSQLKEHHSFLQLPDNLPYKQKEALEEQMAKISGKESTSNHSPYLPSKQMQGHIDRNDNKAFAHLVVPMCIGEYADWEKNTPYFEKLVAQLHDLVVTLQEQKPNGWIVDLRGNSGGNMWPMLAGIAPLLGDGKLGSFDPAGDQWYAENGKIVTISANEKTTQAEVKQPPFTLPELPLVAVLFDRDTASSGEAIAISFAGRSHERSFGEHTAGYSTSNNMHGLSDGAALFLCEGVSLDRTGKRYPDGLDPDVKVPDPESRVAEDKDPVLQAAEKWLGQ
ncbi:MAG TPA: S41 family peptidase [Terriglobales bacterium]